MPDSPDHSRRLAASPRRAFIHDVVVQQGCRVHELDRRRGADVTGVRVATQFRGCQSKHRAKPLAAAIYEVMREFRNHFDLRNSLVQYDAVDSFEILGDQIEKRLELLARFANVF